jgi:hypothetical protein
MERMPTEQKKIRLEWPTRYRGGPFRISGVTCVVTVGLCGPYSKTPNALHGSAHLWSYDSLVGETIAIRNDDGSWTRHGIASEEFIAANQGDLEREYQKILQYVTN